MLPGGRGTSHGAVARRLYLSPGIVNARFRHVFARPGVPDRAADTIGSHGQEEEYR
jgi:hypothetical protein